MRNKEEGKVLVSETLLMFLVEWLEWATTADEDDYRFRRHAGLCAGYVRWCRQRGVGHGEEEREELVGAFRASGLDKNYPFGEDNYDDRTVKYTQHLDPVRLAWVKAVIHNTMREGVK